MQAKVLVDLEQSLLPRHCAQEPRPAGIVPEKPRRARLDSAIRQVRGQRSVIRPGGACSQLAPGQDDVGQDFSDSRFATRAIGAAEASEVSV